MRWRDDARAASLTALVLVLVLLTARATPVRAQEDGCDPDEVGACLELPAEEPAAPGAEGDGRERAAPAVSPPRPCPPPVATAEGPSEGAPAIPVPPRCPPAHELVAAVNRANLAFVRAFRSLDARPLRVAWGGTALAELEGQVALLRAAGRYATPRLLSIGLADMGWSGGSAQVRTVEHWLYQERWLGTGEPALEQDQWVENRYTLVRRGPSDWIVVRVVVTLINVPVPSVALNLSTDRAEYAVGDLVTGTLSNEGTVPVEAGGGFACGLFRIEWFGPEGWQRAPVPEPALPCLAIAQIIRPGESRSQTLPGAPFAGLFRLAFHYRVVETGAAGVVYSAPYLVR
jgi:hypothetical protein